LESKSLTYATVEEFLSDLKEEFREGDNEIMKAVELKKVEQGRKMIEEFVQEFRRTTRESGYKEKLLIEEFKRGINRIIKRKLMEME